MAKLSNIWATKTFSGLTYSFESAIEGTPDGFIEDQTTGELVETSNEFAKLVLESAEISAAVDQVADTADALDNGEVVAQIGDSVAQRDTGATPEEAALVQAGVAQTLDATNAPSEVIDEVTESVATESANGPVLSMEGFKETLAKAWQALKEFVTKVFRGIKDMWNRFWNSTAGVVKDAKKLKEKIKDKELAEKDEDRKIKWSSSFELLAVNGNKFEPSAALAELAKFGKLSEDANKKVADLVSKTQTNVPTIANSSVGKVFGEVKKFVADIVNGGEQNKSKVEDALGSDYVGSMMKMNFGDYAIFHGYNGSYDENGQEASLINSVRAKGAKFRDSFDPKPKDDQTGLTPADIIKLADGVIDVAEDLGQFYNKDSKKLSDKTDEIRKAVDKLVDAADSDKTNAGDKAYCLKVAQRLYFVPTQLFRGLMDQSVFTIRVLKAFIALGNASAGRLVEKKKDK